MENTNTDQSVSAVKSSDSDTFQTFVPTKNMPALLSYYLGLAGLLPFLGLIFSLLGIIYGLKGLKLYKLNPTPGAKGHAMFGTILSAILFAVHFLLSVAVLVNVLNS